MDSSAMEDKLPSSINLDEMDREFVDSSHPKRRHRKLNSDVVVKVAMSLYKVQQNIYLLDFQRIEV